MPAADPKLLVQRTVQSHVGKDDFGLNLIVWLAKATEVVPPWWSKRRDQELRKFWRQVDMLAGAVYALEAKLATIPFHVVPKDYTVTAQRDQAERFEWMLSNACEWGQGWEAFYGKWTQDLITQDNGAFAEIIGDGDPSGPIQGMPNALCTLDSARCDRTSNPEFPVIYQAADGKRYKLHYTRVAFASLQQSPIAEMHGVGFCSVSKCLNISQNLLDILIYNQEKLGSRPTRNIMVTKGGLDPDDVKKAFAIASDAQDSAMLSRYSKTVVIGEQSLPEAGIEMLDLASLPDGFNYETSLSLGMAAIALAFGVDARELWPMTGSGATRADALMQHLKAQTKGIGHLLAIGEKTLFAKILPDTLKAYFDYSDDAQDRQVAEIKKMRSERHQIDLIASQVLDERVVREQMLWDGDLTQAQFNQLELEDGRLTDGSSALQLFYSPEYSDLIGTFGQSVMDTSGDIALMNASILQNQDEIVQKLALTTNGKERTRLRTAYSALEALQKFHIEEYKKTLMPIQGGGEATEPANPEEEYIGADTQVPNPAADALGGGLDLSTEPQVGFGTQT
jgi:hypothetical protein